jgi:hypothetical protein
VVNAHIEQSQQDRDYTPARDAAITADTRCVGLVALGVQAPDEFDQAVALLSGRLLECPECGRIMWRRSGRGRFRVFAPEPSAEPGAAADRGRM